MQPVRGHLRGLLLRCFILCGGCREGSRMFVSLFSTFMWINSLGLLCFLVIHTNEFSLMLLYVSLLIFVVCLEVPFNDETWNIISGIKTWSEFFTMFSLRFCIRTEKSNKESPGFTEERQGIRHSVSLHAGRYHHPFVETARFRSWRMGMTALNQDSSKCLKHSDVEYLKYFCYFHFIIQRIRTFIFV